MGNGNGAGAVLTALADVVDQAGGMEAHGGNLEATARRLGCRPAELLDASASLVPFRLPLPARWALLRADLRSYPDRRSQRLRSLLAGLHQLDPQLVLPGNGAAELFTWAARDASQCGLSVVPQPGFADYGRGLLCWDAAMRCSSLPLQWDEASPRPCPIADLGMSSGSLTPTTPRVSSGAALPLSPCWSAIAW